MLLSELAEKPNEKGCEKRGTVSVRKLVRCASGTATAGCEGVRAGYAVASVARVWRNVLKRIGRDSPKVREASSCNVPSNSGNGKTEVY